MLGAARLGLAVDSTITIYGIDASVTEIISLANQK